MAQVFAPNPPCIAQHSCLLVELKQFSPFCSLIATIQCQLQETLTNINHPFPSKPLPLLFSPTLLLLPLLITLV